MPNEKGICTPGPWTVHPREPFRIVMQGFIESTIARNHCGMFSDATNRANAQLIAAAPDMLYALQLMVSRECGCFNSKNPDWHSDKCFKDIALKAIAKAEGR